MSALLPAPHIFPIEGLFAAVESSFLADGYEVDMLFGWRAPAKKKTAARRITWVPGDPSGTVGVLGAAKKTAGYMPRSLATLDELFTLEFGAVDHDHPESDAASYRATRLLFDAWYRAAYHAARGTFSIVSTGWETRRNERRHGALLRIVIALEAAIPDDTEDGRVTSLTSADGLRAEGTFEVLDVSDHFETAPKPPEDP